MKWILIGTLLFLAFSDILAENLECYICPQVTSECQVADAQKVKCGTLQDSRCRRQIKKGATDGSNAIRKCVVPDSKGNVSPCPDGFDCNDCNTNLCNSGSTFKLTWISVVGIFFSVLYLN